MRLAIALICVAVLFGILLFGIRLRRGPESPAREFWRRVNAWYCKIFHRLRRKGLCLVPAAGPAIVVANHTSPIDPLLLQSTCPRLISFMMAREYYEVKAFSWLFSMVRAIPVNRSGTDTAAAKAALRALGEGRVVGIFPEGRIARGQDVKVRPGVAMMAARYKVPIVPAHISGTRKTNSLKAAFFIPSAALVRYGEPMVLDELGEDPSREQLQESADRIMASIRALAEPNGEEQGVSSEVRINEK